MATTVYNQPVVPITGHSDAVWADIAWRKGSIVRVDGETKGLIHLDNVYNALFNAVETMEARLNQSLATYQEHPDVQANLQQLQYDLQQWNLCLTTMTNIQKNMADALSSIASNMR
ncbi:MAG: hypothetical protein II649_00300 [Kiritimatiellae bacterium]|nr:hypothetical protein [Kiritimatiellia bacterium]